MATVRKNSKKSKTKATSSRASARTNARTKKTVARKIVKRPVAPKRATATNGKNGKNGDVPETKPALSQKEMLQQERATVVVELDRLREQLQEAPEMTGDEVDLNVYEREKTLGLVAAYERRLEEIDATLKVAAEGKYGICERCGKPIEPERLQIFPETRLCVSCKNAIEREQKRARI